MWENFTHFKTPQSIQEIFSTLSSEDRLVDFVNRIERQGTYLLREGYFFIFEK